ncbi:MAG: beta-lactamase family protein [Acidobacteria bacterium]|nr:beta-lactamase family protein [Acidobacteriota bacterium]
MSNATDAIDAARGVIAEAIAARVFPAAALEVGDRAGVLWSEALGTRTFESDSLRVTLQTPFDLASLTKVAATTTVLMTLVGDGRVRLDERLSAMFREWNGSDRRDVTVRDLLEHASGLTARLVDAPPSSRREFEHDICAMPLECPPRAKSIYSDLGFILLGFLAEDRSGAPLADPFKAGGLTFALSDSARALAAPTFPEPADPRRGRLLAGEVHDDYAAALGGGAGHAGLFGSAPDLGAFARVWLRTARGETGLPSPFTPAMAQLFLEKSTVPGSSRALGWDTMLPTSSCGTRMSAAAFGHVGFTGTSLWIDPVRDKYFVLLTNRVCGGGTLDQMRSVRRAFHDALGDV